jgi:putative FmdB family regulatory protein
MPTYEYICKSCGHLFEIVQSMKDDALTECPQCGGELRKVFTAPSIAFKGSGFYATDQRKKASRASETQDKKGSSTSPDAGSGSGSDKGSSTGAGSGDGKDAGSSTSPETKTEKKSAEKKTGGSGKSSGSDSSD